MSKRTNLIIRRHYSDGNEADMQKCMAGIRMMIDDRKRAREAARTQAVAEAETVPAQTETARVAA